MAFLRFRTASPSVPTANETLPGGLSAAQIDGNFKSLNDSKPENNGTGASGTWSISISGNAATASSAFVWFTPRTFTIGNTQRTVDGSSNQSWSLSDIGAAATNQTMFIGTTSVAINRTSGTLALTGISSITGTTTISILTPNTTSANSSSVNIASGSTTTSGISGNIGISSGNVNGGSSRSGNITINSGSTVDGVSGDINIITATSTGAGASGTISIFAGDVKGNTVNAGRIFIQGANTTNTTGSNNGHVDISAGSAKASSGTKYGGKVYIDGGRPAAGGTIVDEGEVLIGTRDTVGGTGTRNIRIGHASATTTITGTVQIPTVGTSGFVKLSANGTLIADTNTYWNTSAGSLVDIYDAGLDDLNNWYLSGFYYLAAGSTNAPTSNEQIVYAAYPGVKTAQISVDASQNALYTRVYDGNTATWGSWSRLVKTSDSSANLSIGQITLDKSLFEKKTVVSSSNIDLSQGNMFTRTISSATTFTVSNTPTTGTVASFILDLTNGGSSTITWWSNVKWPDGTAPELTASGRDVLGFFTHDAGTTWTGLLLGKDVK